MRQSHGKRRAEQLEYIQSMLRQLRGMVEAEGCEMLAYLIEMAYLEANDLVRAEQPLPVGEDKRNSAA